MHTTWVRFWFPEWPKSTDVFTRARATTIAIGIVLFCLLVPNVALAGVLVGWDWNDGTTQGWNATSSSSNVGGMFRGTVARNSGSLQMGSPVVSGADLAGLKTISFDLTITAFSTVSSPSKLTQALLQIVSVTVCPPSCPVRSVHWFLDMSNLDFSQTRTFHLAIEDATFFNMSINDPFPEHVAFVFTFAEFSASEPPMAAAFLDNFIVTDSSLTKLWMGLKNGDDTGAAFDVRVELRKNGDLLATGLTRCIQGIVRSPANAREVTVAFDSLDEVVLDSRDVLALQVLTRIGTNADDTRCTGRGASHRGATGVRLYYDSTTQPSGFGITIGDNPSTELFLHSNGSVCPSGAGQSTGVTTRSLDDSAPTATSAKCNDSGSVNFTGGNPFKAIGTWRFTAP